LDYDGSDDGSDDDDDDDWYKPTPAVELSPAEKAWLGRNERRPPKLSAREERIRKGLMEGKTRKEIAKKEGITASALNTAICRINKKFTEKV
jgi:DNA-binding CsgD family transcriptional regulator